MKIIKTYYLIDYENVGSEGFKRMSKNYGKQILSIFFIQTTAEK